MEKRGRKPDLVVVVEANDLAKLKEKILVGIGTVRTLLYTFRNLSTAQNPPAFVGKMAAVFVNLAILDHFLCVR